MKKTGCGIDHLQAFLKTLKRSEKFGVLCHPSSVDKNFDHLIKIVDENAKLVSLFGPQHGIDCETQANMIEWKDKRDSKGRPVYSLYGEGRAPTDESIRDLDWMIIDLFDVGARLYTYIYTMNYMLEACGRNKVKVLICDRPNPLGGSFVEGNLLNKKYRSFVGLYEIPMCHGMTIAELARFFCSQMDRPPELKVLKLRNWTRSLDFSRTGLVWTLPSPNMPSFSTARIFPGMVFLEGTSLSEGRGTTRPFELVGAPFFNWDAIENLYREQSKKLGIVPTKFHRQSFIPTFDKLQGQTCSGALQIPAKPRLFQPVRHAALLLWIFRNIYGDAWTWAKPPYEYEYEKLPIDILSGDAKLRECVDSQASLKALFKSWQEDEKKFKSLRKPYLLY